MKRHSSMVAAAIVLLLSTGSAYAQSAPSTFKVPFGFIAGETVLAAGEYHITKDRTPGMLQLWGSDRNTILVVAGNIQTLNASTQTKIVFHRYDNRYFLAQIWVEGQNQGREVPIGRLEREMAIKSDSKSMAIIASTGGHRVSTR
jgi:hypothetical protein